jgi:hypothetical protein
MLTRIKNSFMKAYSLTNDFLDKHVLPWPVRFLTFRFVILATMALLIPLILYANNTILVLGINSYLNTMSVAVSSIVLLYSIIAEGHQKQIAQMQEKRAQEDHGHVTEMHRMVLESLKNQQVEIETLKTMLAQLQGETYIPKEIESQPDLQALHPRGVKRFEAGDTAARWQENLYHSDLVSTLRDDLTTSTEE